MDISIFDKGDIIEAKQWKCNFVIIYLTENEQKCQFLLRKKLGHPIPQQLVLPPLAEITSSRCFL